MRTRISRSLLSLLGLLAVAVAPLSADEKPDSETTKRIKHLIGMLASRNAPPRIVDMGRSAEARFGKAYNKNRQVPVYLAMQQLLAEGEPALELLLKHEDDESYCLTVAECDFDYNRTVGDICTRIFLDNIRPFQDDLHFMGARAGGEGYPNLRRQSLKDWWEGKKKVGLANIQIEAIDHQLDFVQKADAKKAVGPIPDAPPLSPAEFEEARKQNTRILKAMREMILSTGKPYRPKTCISMLEYIIGLPWSEVPSRK